MFPTMTDAVLHASFEQTEEAERYVDIHLGDDLCTLLHRLEGLMLAIRAAREELSGDCYANGLEQLCADCRDGAETMYARYKADCSARMVEPDA
jgi:hypothetical protein